MPKIKNPESSPSSAPRKSEDSAGIVWLKLIGLLALLSAFGFVIFWLSRIVHRG